MSSSTPISSVFKAWNILKLMTGLTLMGYAIIFLLWRSRQVSQIYAEVFIAWIWRMFGGTWKGFFVEDQINSEFLALLLINGAIVLFAAILAILIKRPVKPSTRRPVKLLFGLCAFIILCSALSSCFKHYFQFNSLIEYSVRVYIPLLFAHQLWNHARTTNSRLLFLKILLALTFTAHGLYAMNIFPVPSNFLMMTSSILHTGREGSILFLFIVGVLDVIASLALFTRRTEKYALMYMVVWGFLTAMARLAAYYGTLEFADYVIQWLPQFLIRSGHFLLPLYVLLVRREDLARDFRS